MMIKNYVRGAFRNFVKHANFSLIHVAGLALGFTAGIYVIVYAHLEYRYDQFHTDAGRIFRVSTARLRDGVESSTRMFMVLRSNDLLPDAKKHFSIAAVAEECGFNSISSFNTAFRKIVGQTPSEFRNG